MTEQSKRTFVSFGVLIGGALFFAYAWSWISFEPPEKEIAPVLQKTQEFNGKLWSKIFRSSRQSLFRSPVDKPPRVNGDIGLSTKVNNDIWRLDVAEDKDSSPSKHLSLTLKELKNLPRSEASTEFRCIEGWSADISYAGIKFSDFVKAYNLKLKKYVALETVDTEYYVSIDTESMLHDQTILAYEMNGSPLLPENGAPLRLVIPIKYGIKSLKQIGKIYFADERPRDYWEEQGYDWYAGL